MGIGAIPNAVLAQLGGHRHLGIHTEMFADGVLSLVEKGVIDGSNKVTDKGNWSQPSSWAHRKSMISLMTTRWWQ